MAKPKRDVAALVASALAETTGSAPPPVPASKPVEAAPQRPEPGRELTQLTVQVPRQLARDLKAAAALDGTTLRAVIEAAAAEWLARRAVARR